MTDLERPMIYQGAHLDQYLECRPPTPNPPWEVDLVARKQGTQAAPEDGLIVKENETIQLAVSLAYLDHPSVLQDRISWQYRSLNVNGTFGNWTSFQETGTKIEASFSLPCVIQVRAIVTDSGVTTTYNYVRKRDDPHRFDSGGNPNNLYLKGQPDYIGIASETGYAIVHAARQHLGSTYWRRKDNAVTIDPGWVAQSGTHKCNVFVYEAVSPIKTIPTFPPTLYPPRARDWWSLTPEYPMPDWTLYSGSTRAEPGVVIARPDPDPIYQLRGYGHCGITDYDGAWINAGPGNVNRFLHISLNHSQPASFKK
jgi:hypothetical protein